MKFKSYKEYKDSGVEWIGDIPEHWDVLRNKNIFYEVSNYSETGDETLLTVSHITGVTPRSEKNVNMFLAETMQGYKLTEPEDLLINTMWAWMGALGTNNYYGICSPAYNVYRRYREIPYDRKYFDYLLRTPNSIVEMTRYSKGIVSSRLRLYPSEFFQIMSPLPPYKEQKHIADYLDTKISHINRKIKLLKRKKERYIELKFALINRLVTRGLDDSQERKNVELEWIGEIPRSWKVKRIKENYDLVTGNSLANKELYMDKSGGIPYIATKDIDISSLQVDYDNGIYIPRNDNTFKVAKKHSTLICLEGGSAGKKLTYIDREVAYVNKLCAIKKRGNSKLDKYVYYFLQSNIFKTQFFSVLNGLIGGVSMSLISNFIIITPPDEEQERIIKYLDSKIEVIDMIGSKIQKQIETLEELQKTLINDVVTGKVKVT